MDVPPPATMPGAAPVVEALGLERRFGRTVALAGVDLRLGAGEAMLVVGPNGAGKSTLLRTLAGLARPTRGQVSVCGRPLAGDDPGSRRPIGLVAHRSLLYDDLSLLENLTFAARLYGLDAPADVAATWLARVGLAGREGMRPRALSRGMLQRAAIARALLHAPRLLLLDEPFTGLDAEGSERLRALVHERLAAGAAALVVTHTPGECWPLVAHAAALVAGRWALQLPASDGEQAFLARYREVAAA